MERLKGFTLLEVTVAMLLTGILVVMAYGIISSFDRLAARFFHVDDDVEQLRELQLALIMDSDRSAVLIRTSDGFTFTNEQRHITYSGRKGAVIRTADERIDTFAIELTSLRTYWQQLEVTATESPVDQLAATVTVAGDTLPLHLEHHYDAITLRSLER